MSILRKRGKRELARWKQRKAAKRNARPDHLGRLPKRYPVVRSGLEKAFKGIHPLSPVERDEALTRGYRRISK